jgi:peptidyl-prolyl cis-trans isomerase B (cyclophilin B)
MALWAKRYRGVLRQLAVAAIVVSLGLVGCGKKTAEAPQVEETESSKTGQANGGAAAHPVSTVGVPDYSSSPAPDDWQHQPFVKATRRGDDPPAECNRPPDTTISNKPVFKLYSEVVRQWDAIRFVSPAGKRIDYSAVIETDLGVIEITFRPDLAPNHVRNFVALAQAGYYDGLFFDRIYHDESDEGMRLDEIEAGCPMGTGDPGNGSIGYWLNPEFSDKVTHDEGTLGACHGIEADTAACRFYITLGKAPFLDGSYTVFGKVTQGLDVARKIFAQPLIIDEQDQTGHRRPEKPILIRKVTIHSQETENTSAP